MRVRQDVAIGADDDARTQPLLNAAPLFASTEKIVKGGALAAVAYVLLRLDGYDGGLHLRCELGEGIGELLQVLESRRRR